MDNKPKVDYTKLHEVVSKLATQQNEIYLVVNEMREILNKQRDDELLRRLEKLELRLSDQSVKLDALNAIDITPTIAVPKAVVKIAKKRKEDDDVVIDAEPPPAAAAAAADDLKTFSNITEYFKYLWVTSRDSLYEKNVLTKEDYDKIYEENRDKFEKKKGNELILQKSIAFQIWKSLPQENKDIVHAMRKQNNAEWCKKNSAEIHEELLDG